MLLPLWPGGGRDHGAQLQEGADPGRRASVPAHQPRISHSPPGTTHEKAGLQLLPLQLQLSASLPHLSHTPARGRRRGELGHPKRSSSTSRPTNDSLVLISGRSVWRGVLHPVLRPGDQFRKVAPEVRLLHGHPEDPVRAHQAREAALHRRQERLHVLSGYNIN